MVSNGLAFLTFNDNLKDQLNAPDSGVWLSFAADGLRGCQGQGQLRHDQGHPTGPQELVKFPAVLQLPRPNKLHSVKEHSGKRRLDGRNEITSFVKITDKVINIISRSTR